MGMPEIVVIMVIAFLALGPGKSIDMARTAGRLMRDLRRTFNEVSAAVSLDDVDAPPPRRPDTPVAPSKGDPPKGDPPPTPRE